MRVVHVSPSYFADESVIGGGERYTQELARAMADLVPASLISFGSHRHSFTEGKLSVHVFPAGRLPASLPQITQLLGEADVIHCHQLGTAANVVALLVGKVLGKRRFVTPLGLSPSRWQHRMMKLAGFSGSLCISEYSSRHSWYSAPRYVIGAGVDSNLFHPRSELREEKIVYVGRLAPHKGINYLIEALDSDMRLEIYGRPHNQRYLSDLRTLARNKNVQIRTDASDNQIAEAYGTSLVAALPSVYVDMYGATQAEPELLGLVLLEAMASGTAVVGTRVASIPEYIDEGVNGYVVPPNDVLALRNTLRRLFDDPDHAASLGRNGLEWVRRECRWLDVARRCIEIYSRA